MQYITYYIVSFFRKQRFFTNIKTVPVSTALLHYSPLREDE
ncbi:hypothetical protein BQ1740_0675 [Bacillus subtilis]|nr:hypothetical protein BQ1740_0675 [Bacillus subtilis]